MHVHFFLPQQGSAASSEYTLRVMKDATSFSFLEPLKAKVMMAGVFWNINCGRRAMRKERRPFAVHGGKPTSASLCPANCPGQDFPCAGESFSSGSSERWAEWRARRRYVAIEGESSGHLPTAPAFLRLGVPPLQSHYQPLCLLCHPTACPQWLAVDGGE